MSPQITLMCEAVLVLTQLHGTFSMKQLHEHMGARNYEARSNLTARLMRLVDNDVVRITNQQAVEGGGTAMFAATRSIIPYMHGDRAAFLAIRNDPEIPAICDVWGIRFPKNWHTKPYPRARIHKSLDF